VLGYADICRPWRIVLLTKVRKAVARSMAAISLP
jgi:hypothetical protein